MPLITVMIPTYNQADYLVEAVESTLAQDHGNLEVLILDDASTDHTPLVSARFAHDPRVRILRSEVNLGRVANYRRGLYDAARGAWVINLDGDDCFKDPSYLSAALALGTSQPDIVMVFGQLEMGAVRHAPSNRILNQSTAEPSVMAGNDFIRRHPPLQGLGPLHATCLYRREDAMAEGFYTCNILSADFESFYRLMLNRRVGYVPRIAAFWRQHGKNASAAPRFDAVIANLAVFDGPAARAEQLGVFSPAEAKAWRSRQKASVFVSLLLRSLLGRIGLADPWVLLKHLRATEKGALLAISGAILRRITQRG